ncbi:helix-turn-helix domain-containing protein [Hymenobacter sp. BT186]|uniref:Helix-turn-helix domain-containing protein n=1 Tax=Hymenobacter telluris TaxID=2816474 RepID=A0A939JD23_9BACT|nr:helix-turn-helix domain-containing protein [Hymenobacter telluris]MBW3373924.1 helix-turn-helix transcriptional regulator [Hymenobacter norwichensis]
MVDRIREILSARQLTPTQFADTIGVARPIVSHILSGRNKPSLEVVQKIVDAFPDVSLAWLLKGIGSMTTPEVPPAAPTPAPTPSATKRLSTKTPETARPALSREQTTRQPVTSAVAPTAAVFEANSGVIHSAAPGQEVVSGALVNAEPGAASIPGPSKAASTEPKPAATVEATPVSDNSISTNTSDTIAAPGTIGAERRNSSDATGPSVAQPFLQANKAIRRIVIFYQDGTFTDYQPENV